MPTIGDKVYSLDPSDTDDEATEALLDIANTVGTAPTVAEVEQVLR